MKDYQFLQQKYLVPTYPRRGLTFVRGKGVYLFDEKGNQYLDLMTNYGVNIFGYNHPKITKRLGEQIKRLTNLHCSFANDKRAEASEKLVKRCKGDCTQVYWSNSGSEAVEAALKFAVLATGKKRFIAAKNAYHGKTLGALSATTGEKYRKFFEPLLWEFFHVEYGNTEKLAKMIDNKTAAVILEPIQGEGGVVVPPEEYLSKVRKICDKKGILLILDEIQTGIGRTGRFLASETDGINADILCLGKSLAAGMPVGATLVTQTIANEIPKSVHTSTFGGNPLTCTGVLITLELLDETVLENVRRVGNYFLNSLKEIKSKQMVEVRGRGLMIGIEVKGSRDKILKRLQQRKILAIPAGEHAVRFLPPYIITKQEIDQAIKALQEIL